MTQHSSRRAPGDGRYFSAGAGGPGCECVSEHRAETTRLAAPPLPTRRSIKLSRIGGSVFAQLAVGLLSLVKTTGASRVAAIAAATAQKAQAATSSALDDAKEAVDPRRYRGRWQDRATPAQMNVMLQCAEQACHKTLPHIGSPSPPTRARFTARPRFAQGYSADPAWRWLICNGIVGALGNGCSSWATRAKENRRERGDSLPLARQTHARASRQSRRVIISVIKGRAREATTNVRFRCVPEAGWLVFTTRRVK